MTSELVIDAVRRKRRVTLAELRAMRVEVPELQRPAEQERVADIMKHHVNRGRVCLVGGDLVVAVSSEGSRWLVDGQHRFLALLGLADAFPENAVCIEEVDLAAPGAPTLPELFRLINSAVPVPEYIVNGTLETHERGAVDVLAALVKARFSPFLSASHIPRRPNVNLRILMDRVAAQAGGPLAPLIAQGGGDRLFAYLLCSNERLRNECSEAARARAEEKARKHRGAAPLFLAEDPDAAWASDAAAIDAFVRVPPGPVARSERERDRGDVAMSCPIRRQPIPLALRYAVWNAAHGEKAGEGWCRCCNKSVTQQTFECGHIVPVAHDGGTTVDNLCVLCRTCNRSMGSEHLDAFKARMGFS